MLQMDVHFTNARAFSGYEMTQSGVVNVIEKDDGYETVNFTPELAKNAFRDFLDIAGNFPDKTLRDGKPNFKPITSKELRSQIIAFYDNYGPLMQPSGEFAVSEQHFQGVIQSFNQFFTTDDFDLNINAKRFGEINKAFKAYASPDMLIIYFLWMTVFPIENSWVVCQWRLINGAPRKRNNGETCPTNCILSNRKGKLWGPNCRQAWQSRKEK